MGGSAHRCPPCGCVLGKWASASTCSRPASLQSGAPNFPEEHTLRAWTSLRHRDLVSSCFPPRDVDCGRAATISPRLAVAHRVELEKHYLLFFFFLLYNSGANTHAVCTGTDRPPEQGLYSRSTGIFSWYYWFQLGDESDRSVGIALFNDLQGWIWSYIRKAVTIR